MVVLHFKHYKLAYGGPAGGSALRTGSQAVTQSITMSYSIFDCVYRIFRAIKYSRWNMDGCFPSRTFWMLKRPTDTYIISKLSEFDGLNCFFLALVAITKIHIALLAFIFKDDNLKHCSHEHILRSFVQTPNTSWNWWIILYCSSLPPIF